MLGSIGSIILKAIEDSNILEKNDLYIYDEANRYRECKKILEEILNPN